MATIPDSQPKVMTQQEYAKRRGVSGMTVSRAIKRGKLVKSVVFSPTGKPLGIADPELADQEWAANSDYTDAPARESAGPVDWEDEPETPKASEPVTLSEAATEEKRWRAKLAELKYRETAGELVPSRDVEQKLTGKILACRTRLLGIPTRARQALPHLSVTDIGTLETLVRESLEELAAEGGTR